MAARGKRTPRAKKPAAAKPVKALAAPQPKRKGVVAIVAMGYSIADWLTDCMRHGHYREFVDEVWLINSAGLVLKGDRCFMMDDMKILGDPAYQSPLYVGKDHTNRVLDDWARNHADMPIFTSRKRRGYKTAVEYPIADVIKHTGTMWYANSVSYAVGLADTEGIACLRMYGCDFYAKEAAAENQGGWEHGMANLVHHLTLFKKAGGIVQVAPSSVLLDRALPTYGQLYGYTEQPHLYLKRGRAAAAYGKEADKMRTDQQSKQARAAKRAAKGAKP